ncbi:MAG TPA: hypothetical protein VGD64_04460 [Acidisarcina sp.]
MTVKPPTLRMPRTPKLRANVLAIAIALASLVSVLPLSAQEAHTWRVATEAELKSLIPARAPVEKERIETELRTASGITDGHGRFIAGVVLITAGYSAEGKYSHFFIVQAPVHIGDSLLPPGEYLIGWQHMEDSLNVNFYESGSGRLVAHVPATRNPAITRVESFRIYAPADKSVVQIGRFTFPYRVGD